MDEYTISPAGDPFYAASRRDHEQDERPHGCIAGVVYIGHIVEDENGEEVEVFEAVPCRRYGELTC